MQLTYNINNIPQALKDLAHWVCWNTETRPGEDKPTKVLKNPRTGGNAMPNNSSTWGTFDAALKAMARYGLDGIGFVFTESGPYCGIDLDNCIDPQTGEIESWALEIIEQMNSYTEISPSGTGLHIIIKGSLPEGGNRKGAIEMYDKGRYFTVTGNHLKYTPKTIEARQDELTNLHAEIFNKPPEVEPPAPKKPVNLTDREIIEKACSAKNGREFERLWNGNWQGDYPSQSEADLAFCSMLAFWCGNDPQCVDSIFRQSGLMRKKWDERHYSNGSTYGQEVIHKAVSGTHEVYSQRKEQPIHTVGVTEFEPAPDLSLILKEPDHPTPSERIYHGVLGDIVKKIEPHSEAAPIGIFMSLLIYFAAMIGRGASLTIEATRHYLNLYVALIGPTGIGRKGTATGYADLIYSSIDEPFLIYNVISGLSSGEGLVDCIRDPIYNNEGEIDQQGVEDKRLLVREEELAQPFVSMQRKGNNLESVLRSNWDGKPVGTQTKNSKTICAKPYISILGHSTKEEFLKVSTQTQIFNGLVNRILFVAVQKSKSLSRGGKLHTVDFSDDMRQLREALAFAKQTQEMSMSEAAWQTWDKVYPELTAEVPGLLGSATSRATAQVRRLSCLYALLDCSSVVEAQHLKAALALWQYAFESARYLFGDGKLNTNLKTMVRRIIDAINDNPEGLTKTQLRLKVIGSKSSELFDNAIDFIRENKLAVTIKIPTDGANKEVWYPVGYEGSR